MNCRDFRLVDYQLSIDVNMTAVGAGFSVKYNGIQTFKPATSRGEFSVRDLQCLNVGSGKAIPAGKFMFQRLAHCGLRAYSIASNSYANAGQIVITHDSGGGYPETSPGFASANLSAQASVASPDGPYFQAVPFNSVGNIGSGVPPVGSTRARNCYKNSPGSLFSYIYIRDLFDPEFLDAEITFNLFDIGVNNAIGFFSRWGEASGSCLVEITTGVLPP